MTGRMGMLGHEAGFSWERYVHVESEVGHKGNYSKQLEI